MNVPELLNSARLDLGILAKAAGVSHGYLRLIAIGERKPGRETARKLAAALRAHGVTLREIADHLDPQ
jgi:transcriptional regulator with XRE-family HTH domain